MSEVMSPRYMQLEVHALVIDAQQDRIRKTSVKGALVVGKELHAARVSLGHKGDGLFGEWCRKRLKMSRTTVFKLICAYQVFGDCSFCEQSFSLSALYLLSKNGVPKEAIDDAISIASAGGMVTPSRARTLIDTAYEAERMADAKDEEPKEEKPKRRERDSGEGDDSDEADEDSEDDEDETPNKYSMQARPPIERLKRAWSDASRRERREFKKWIKDWQKTTEIDAEDGTRQVLDKAG